MREVISWIESRSGHEENREMLDSLEREKSEPQQSDFETALLKTSCFRREEG